MLRFFCTRCGAQLQVNFELAGRLVRCGRCSDAVRTPAGHETPVADVIDDDAGEVALEPQPVVPLQYFGPRPPPLPTRTYYSAEPVEVLAERLTRVENPVGTDASAMTNCPHCGSTIARYVGRCPFCRHPLAGS